MCLNFLIFIENVVLYVDERPVITEESPELLPLINIDIP